jgi:hypothetical protein
LPSFTSSWRNSGARSRNRYERGARERVRYASKEGPSLLRFAIPVLIVSINHFLIIYDLRRGKLIDFQLFGHDIDRATEAYAETEREYRERSDHEDFEIVLVGADSRETIEQTHSRYFKSRQTVPF